MNTVSKFKFPLRITGETIFIKELAGDRYNKTRTNNNLELTALGPDPAPQGLSHFHSVQEGNFLNMTHKGRTNSKVWNLPLAAK
jgi:hypothetical protein